MDLSGFWKALAYCAWPPCLRGLLLPMSAPAGPGTVSSVTWSRFPNELPFSETQTPRNPLISFSRASCCSLRSKSLLADHAGKSIQGKLDFSEYSQGCLPSFSMAPLGVPHWEQKCLLLPSPQPHHEKLISAPCSLFPLLPAPGSEGSPAHAPSASRRMCGEEGRSALRT